LAGGTTHVAIHVNPDGADTHPLAPSFEKRDYAGDNDDRDDTDYERANVVGLVLAG
jgi:hypothetical protein